MLNQSINGPLGSVHGEPRVAVAQSHYAGHGPQQNMNQSTARSESNFNNISISNPLLTQKGGP